MCTAILAGESNRYFGRNLDFEEGFGEKITITPRNFPLSFGDEVWKSHYAIMGMAVVQAEYPLYFDGINEAGVGMAGLLFPREAAYQKPEPGKVNIPSYQLIPRVLGGCKSVREAKTFLANANITDESFSEALPATPLHWMIADKTESLVVEQTREGLLVYENPAGVLTNSPDFRFQMQNLNRFLGLSAEDPVNRFSPKLELTPYSRGMGAVGLPGDLSSPSRFVRACFAAWNSVWSGNKAEDVSQFFHILSTVSQTMGCNRAGEKWEFTRYSSCCDIQTGVYYYTTYRNSRISAVDLFAEPLEGNALIAYDLHQEEPVFFQNR